MRTPGEYEGRTFRNGGFKNVNHRTNARVRIISGSLEGLEGTVVSPRRNNRLLIRLHTDPQGVCAEIDAQVVEFLDDGTFHSQHE